MIFDFRVYLGKSFDSTSQSVEQLLTQMDALGIDEAFAIPFKPVTYDLDQANRTIAQSVRDHADRLSGAARIDPWQPNSVDLLRKALETYGLKGLFLNPWEENFRADDRCLDGLMEIMQAVGFPVIVATGFPWVSEALQVSQLAQQWPNIPVVMTNGGQINISGLGQADVTLALQRASNLLIDTAGVYRQDFLEETVEAFGAERMLFSSGAPYFDQAFEIKRLQFGKFTEEARSAIQFKNAHRLIGKGLL